MAIPDSDPRAKDLDAAFAAAAAGPQKPRAEAKTPADIDQDAPFGRNDDGTAKAPYGTTKDGKVKRSAGGRPPKNDPDHARTAAAEQVAEAAKPAAPKGKPEPHDYSEDLDGFGDLVWFGMSAAAKVTPKIPLLGKIVPGPKLAAEAFVFDVVKPQLVAAVNLAAQHDARTAAFCRKLEGGGDGLWALKVAFMLVPVADAFATVWKGDPEAMEAAGMPPVAEMAKRNEAKMDEALARISAQIEAATAAAAPVPVPAEQAA